MRIGLIGGTGKEGTGLGLRWARAGHEILVGSRDAARAAAHAASLAARSGGRVTGGDNAWAAREAELAVLCVPYKVHGATLGSLGAALRGKVLVDITVPLVPPAVREVHLPPGQAAALEAQQILGPEVHVVAALHHISSVHLGEVPHSPEDGPPHDIDSDVLVCADHAGARDTVMALIGDLGLRALDAGPLRNAIALESLTPVLLYMNRRYKSSGTGVRITGIP